MTNHAFKSIGHSVSRRCASCFYCLLFILCYVMPALAGEHTSTSYQNLAEDSPIKVKIRLKSITVRERPSLKAPVVTWLKRDQNITLIHKTGDWYIVKLEDNRVGWAHFSLFEEKKLDSTPSTFTEKRILKISIDRYSEQNEKILFKLNGLYPPDTFVLEGENPRVVCDFFYTLLDPSVHKIIEVNGNLIKQVRIAQHIGPKPRIRAVLDLVPVQDYEVEQLFFEKENIYAVTVFLKQTSDGN